MHLKANRWLCCLILAGRREHLLQAMAKQLLLRNDNGYNAIPPSGIEHLCGIVGICGAAGAGSGATWCSDWTCRGLFQTIHIHVMLRQLLSYLKVFTALPVATKDLDWVLEWLDECTLPLLWPHVCSPDSENKLPSTCHKIDSVDQPREIFRKIQPKQKFIQVGSGVSLAMYL